MAVLVNVPDLSKPISDKDFTKFLEDNMSYILSITPHNPIITKDDEWNDPIYDHYAKIDDEEVD